MLARDSFNGKLEASVILWERTSLERQCWWLPLLLAVPFIIQEILYFRARVGNALVLFLLTVVSPVCVLLIHVYNTSNF